MFRTLLLAFAIVGSIVGIFFVLRAEWKLSSIAWNATAIILWIDLIKRELFYFSYKQLNNKQTF